MVSKNTLANGDEPVESESKANVSAAAKPRYALGIDSGKDLLNEAFAGADGKAFCEC